MKSFRANIIINTYKGNQKDLIKSVESCLNQRRCKVSLIVSTVLGDPSIETLRGLDLNMVISSKPGIYSQLNAAAKELTEDWWCYFSGNDIAYPEKLYSEIKHCLDNKAKICYSAFDAYNASSKKLSTRRFHDYSFNKHLEGNFVTDVATMHRSISDKYAPFSEDFDNMGYWDFWLRVGLEHPEYFAYNPAKTFKYIISKDSRHVKRKSDEKWKRKEFEDRVRMLRRFGPLRGRYKDGYKG